MAEKKNIKEITYNDITPFFIKQLKTLKTYKQYIDFSRFLNSINFNEDNYSLICKILGFRNAVINSVDCLVRDVLNRSWIMSGLNKHVYINKFVDSSSRKCKEGYIKILRDCSCNICNVGINSALEDDIIPVNHCIKVNHLK